MNCYRYLRRIVLTALLSVFLLGCDKTPIFYTLEGVYPIEKDLGLENNIAVFEMALFSDTDTWYFAATGTLSLYARSDSGDNWKRVSPPVAGAFCETVEVFSTDTFLYAGFYKADGTGLGLYRVDPDDNPASFDDSTTTISTNWTQIGAAAVQDVQIGMIKDVGGTLYVATAEWNDTDKMYEYFFYSSADGYVVPINFKGNPTLASPVVDIVERVAGEYWAITGDDLYSDTDGTLDDMTLQNPDPTEPQTSDSFGGFLDSTVTAGLFLSAKDGKLWRYDGSDWDDTTTVEIDETGVRFTRFIDDTRNNDILVGTERAGYYKLVLGSLSNVQRLPSPTLDLYNSAINSFYLDTAVPPGILFACTYGSGLWREVYDTDSGEWKWYQE